jgi:hypothetical protein
MSKSDALVIASAGTPTRDATAPASKSLSPSTTDGFSASVPTLRATMIVCAIASATSASREERTLMRRSALEPVIVMRPSKTQSFDMPC